MTAWMVVTVVSKSSTNWLIETFITDWSSTITNCAVAKATSGNQRFIGVPFSPARPGAAAAPILARTAHSNRRPMTTASQISPFLRG